MRLPTVEWPGRVRNSLATNNQQENINSNYIASSAHEVAPESTNSVEEIQQLVTFANDNAVVPEHMPHEKELPSSGNEQHDDFKNHSIVTFMEYSQRIDSFMWRKELKIGDILSDVAQHQFVYDVPAIGLTPLVLNKLDGITSFRATLVVRLQLNSQPFQQGRLILAAIPMPFLIGDRAKWLMKHPSLLQSVNHVQVDISKHTEVTLSIPFVSPFNSFDLISNKYQWARVVCMVYSALKDPLNVGVPVQVWTHFEKVQLGTATSGQFGLPDGPVAVEQGGAPAPDPSVSAVRQSRVAESTGKISSTIAGVGRGVKAVSDAVGSALPFLSPVTGVVSSIAGIGSSVVGGLGSLFGFSKPQTSQSGSTIVQRPCEGFGNMNGVDHSHVLGLDRLNNVDVYPGLGGTELDEQDLTYVTKIPQFIGQFLYTNQSSYDTPLWSTYVSPTYYLPGSVKIKGSRELECDNFIDELQPTVLNYVSSFFVYWTGSLVYTFRFVKTNYHSGRVEISFHPFTNGVQTDRMNYSYRAVVDLRETTEVSLTIPFVSPQPWKRIIPADPMGKADWETYGSCATGRLQVRAITPLILSSAVVVPEVHCVVEIRAGNDYRLQSPVSSTYLMFTPSGGDVEGQAEDELVAFEQSGPIALPGTAETRTSAIEGYSPPSITTSSLDTQRSDTQRFCAGEQFKNLRALTRKFAFIRKESGIRTYRNSLTMSAAPYIRPPRLTSNAWTYQGGGNLGSAPRFLFEWGHSPLSQVAGLYAFYRGSLRFKVFAPSVKRLISARTVFKNEMTGYVDQEGKNVKKQVFFPFNAIAAYELPDIKGFAEFQLPFYSPVMLAVPSDIERLAEFDQSSCAINISFFSSSADEVTDVHIATGGGDDLTFHTFIGLAPIITRLRFQNPVHILNCNAGRIWTTPFSQVGYMGSHANADPCFDIEPLDGEGWTEETQSKKWVSVSDLDFSVPNIQGNRENSQVDYLN